MTAVKRSAAVTAPAPSVGRDYALDAVRGLAILLMVADHLSYFMGWEVVRLTAGRVAMPLFFLVAGHLAGSPKWRHVRIGFLGLLLPLAVPWIDNPNVLVLWAAGVALLWCLRYFGHLAAWVTVVALTLLANGWGFAPGNGYDWLALWGLMAVGHGSATHRMFGWGNALPEWVAAMGRHPIAWYVGHLAVLQGVFILVT